jgi:hypothetical protein
LEFKARVTEPLVEQIFGQKFGPAKTIVCKESVEIVDVTELHANAIDKQVFAVVYEEQKSKAWNELLNDLPQWLEMTKYMDGDARYDKASLYEEHKRYCIEEFERRWSEGKIPLQGCPITWSATTSADEFVRGSAYASGARQIGHLYLTAEGFKHDEPDVCVPCVMLPDTRYCSILDPDKNQYLRSYSIAREIAPGDADHFQIMVGSTKSAKYSLRFCFDADEGTRINSKIFSLEISNPRDASFHDHYVDGDEVLLALKRARHKMVSSKEIELGERRIWVDEKEISEYPFIDTKRRFPLIL